MSRDRDVAVILRGLFAKSPDGVTYEEMCARIAPLWCGLVSCYGTPYRGRRWPNRVRQFLHYLGATNRGGKWHLREASPPTEEEVRRVVNAARDRLRQQGKGAGSVLTR